MRDIQAEFIDVTRLRVGHYVFIDLGWISHPFPLNSFKIQSKEQIDKIRSLGIDRIRYSSQRSDPEPEPEPAPPLPSPSVRPLPGRPRDKAGQPHQPGQNKNPRRKMLTEQRASLQKCERLFDEASRAFRQIAESVHACPETARDAAQSLVDGMTCTLHGEQESCIRLLSESVGERSSLHAINVSVISLLLGKACGLDETAMRDVGVGALLHDLGKTSLPNRLRYQDGNLSASERQIYQDHVRHGVEMGKRMNLSKGALLVIGQHHECANGSGYPLSINNDRMSPPSRIVALVDRYDNLCNPSNPAQALTPYEAMSHLFAQRKQCFDHNILGIFVRMMGVYPPGSVVQLTDDRYAMVVSVNASRPLKPSVIIHDQSVPREEALVVDLGDEPSLGIRRSLRPLQLPKATFDYLSPRQRVCYFFEHCRCIGDEGAPA